MRTSNHKFGTTIQLNSAINGLFNVPVAAVAKEPANYCERLGVLESRLTQSMRSARLLDFSTGRLCAHEALQSIGLTVSDIDSGEHREPLWPEGIRGSISHCQGVAVAVVTDAPQCLGLGFDIEPLSCLEGDVMRLVCTDLELEWIEKTRNNRLPGNDPEQAGGIAWQTDQLACLLFSIKEAIFKCYFPLYKQWFDFRQATVIPDLELKEWQVEFDPNLPFATLPELQRLTGRFDYCDGFCLCSAVLTSVA